MLHTPKCLNERMRVLVNDDARCRHVKNKLEQTQRTGRHNVVCSGAHELADPAKKSDDAGSDGWFVQ